MREVNVINLLIAVCKGVFFGCNVKAGKFRTWFIVLFSRSPSSALAHPFFCWEGSLLK